MSDITQVSTAQAEYIELLQVNQALALIAAGSTITQITLSASSAGAALALPMPNVTPPAGLTTALTNRQTTLRNALTAAGYTNVP